MPLKYHNPKNVSVAGRYSLGVEVPPGARTLLISGQVGVDAQGNTGAGIEKQCELAWENLGSVLKAAGMDYANIAKVTIFLTDPRYVGPYRTIRDKFIATPPPASTLLIVAGLAAPEMLVEIEAIAVA